jgi:hypothetical protein
MDDFMSLERMEAIMRQVPPNDLLVLIRRFIRCLLSVHVSLPEQFDNTALRMPHARMLKLSSQNSRHLSRTGYTRC